MAQFTVNILGCGSATPTMRHQPSCQVIDFRDRLFMVDCGEGAQLQLRRMHLKFSRLNHIFISHLHGDHFLGLPGLLSTLSLHECGGSIVVHTFEQGARILQQLMDVFCHDTSFAIEYDIIKPEHAVIYEDHALTVETVALSHRVPTVGFIFREKPKERHIIPDMIAFHQVPVSRIRAIKQGADYVKDDGTVIANDRLTRPADPAMSYAYCSDTMYDPALAEALRGVDTIYHESTYLDEYEQKARERGHSTARQAARIAAGAGARRLILGHYSQRYESEEPFVAEAATEFGGEIIAAREGMKINLL
ncbi:MAG: ribonuclease Z [Muribaculaceae bacterium]